MNARKPFNNIKFLIAEVRAIVKLVRCSQLGNETAVDGGTVGIFEERNDLSERE